MKAFSMLNQGYIFIHLPHDRLKEQSWQEHERSDN